MREPSSRLARAVPAIRGLWHDDATPVCFLDEEYNLAYRNPAFDRLAAEQWHLAGAALNGRSLLTSLPLPAPLLMALAGLKAHPKPERLDRLQLGPTEAYWDVQVLPYKESDAMVGVAMLFHDRTDDVRRARDEQSQRRLLAAILEASREALVWVTPDGLARLENAAASALFGGVPVGSTRPVRELMAGGVWLAAEGAPLGAGQDPFEAAAAGRSLAPTEVLLRRPGQAERRLRAGVTPVLPMAGETGAALVAIGEAMPAAPAVEAPSTFLTSLLAAIPSVLYYLDTDMRVQMANRYLLKQIGLTEEQVLGKPLSQVMALPGDYLAAIREAMHTGHSVHRPYIGLRDPRNGRQTYWDNYVTPVTDAEGALQGLVVLSNDVTWRVELTQALADKVHQLATILGHIADGVVVATPDGELLLVNEAAQRLLSLSAQGTLEDLERFDVRSMADVPIPAHEMPITRVLRGEPVGEEMAKLVDEDGQEVMLAISGAPIVDDADRVLMGVLVFHDITEEVRLRQALTEKIAELEQAVASLREIDRLKSNFLNTISHELRTPLTNIIGFVELIEDQVLGPLAEPQKEVVGHVMTSARHLLTLINDLLDFTQLEAGKIAFSFVPVSLGMLAEQVVPAVRTKSGKDLHVAIREPANAPRARADHSRTMQVFEQLLDNAFKFTPEGGHIEVTVTPDAPGMVRVTISDSGIGIPEEDQAGLFSKFYQVESGLRREQGGTGLGLAICKMLVEKQGGQIGLSSKPGDGTCVWFTLPVWEERPDEPEARTSPSAAS